jgi:hypothetical protein
MNKNGLWCKKGWKCGEWVQTHTFPHSPKYPKFNKIKDLQLPKITKEEYFFTFSSHFLHILPVIIHLTYTL